VMSDNSGATKTATTTNVGPWQQGNNMGWYEDRGDDGPDREDNDATTGNNRGNRTATE
jgi:hypothetical protein